VNGGRPLALVALGAYACAVGPDFKRPPPPKVTRYTNGAPMHATITADGQAQIVRAGAQLAADWWRLFHSTKLDAVIAEAIANNQTLEAARASLRKSQYQLQAGYGVFYPQLDVNAGATPQRFTPSRFAFNQAPSVFHLFTLGGTLGYTLDMFGGERRTVEGLHAQVDVQRYGVAAARLLLTGNVANTAIAHAGYQAEIVATEELIDRLKTQVQITEAQASSGTVPFSNVLSVRAQLASVAATLPPLHQRLVQAEDLLATLVGRPPADWRQPEIALADLSLPRDLPVSLPSELVRQRPDILVAEATLHASSANIGVATAAMFPSFSLNGTLGFNNTSIASLFEHNSLFWSIGANMLAPLFHGGTLANQRFAAIAAYQQSLASYRQTVLDALRDVADSLRALEHDAELVDAESQAIKASGEALKLTEINYKSGLANYLQVLIADVQFHQATIAHIQAQAQRLQDTVALFVALGGGWWTAKS
jgi:NodT family efflux transporter outer membrane factor (OMF) lipoprotein